MSISLPGLSGYDFTTIVNSMVQVYSQPKQKMTKQQSELQVKQDAWRDIKTRLSALEKTLANLKSDATWNAKKATSSKSDILAVAGSPEAINGVYNVKVKSVAQAQTVVSKELVMEKSTTQLGLDGVFKITVGDKTEEIEVKVDDSLKDLADLINSKKVGISASVLEVDEGKYRLVLVADKTGVTNKASFENVSGNALSSLDLLNPLNETQEAKDAEVEVNGITGIKSASNTVTNAILGLTLTLNEEALDTTVKVTVSSDHSVAEKAIQSFIDQYNSVQDFIANKLSYDKETKRSGDLFGDPVLQNIQERLRRIVTSYQNLVGEGNFNLLSEIGITTTSENYGISGKLEFDTSKFRDAMKENPSSVANLFGAVAGGITPRTEKTENGSTQGLANILGEYLNPMTKYDGSIDEMRKNLSDQIDDIKKRIEDFNDRIIRYEENLRLKFARLESTLAELSGQYSWLQTQITAMTAQLGSKK